MLLNLRDQIPLQCGIKGDWKVGFLRNRHVLIRLELIEDFTNILSMSAYYISSKDENSYQMHPLKYYSNFKSTEDATKVIAWNLF